MKCFICNNSAKDILGNPKYIEENDLKFFANQTQLKILKKYKIKVPICHKCYIVSSQKEAIEKMKKFIQSKKILAQ